MYLKLYSLWIADPRSPIINHKLKFGKIIKRLSVSFSWNLVASWNYTKLGENLNCWPSPLCFTTLGKIDNVTRAKISCQYTMSHLYVLFPAKTVQQWIMKANKGPLPKKVLRIIFPPLQGLGIRQYIFFGGVVWWTANLLKLMNWNNQAAPSEQSKDYLWLRCCMFV